MSVSSVRCCPHHVDFQRRNTPYRKRQVRKKAPSGRCRIWPDRYREMRSGIEAIIGLGRFSRSAAAAMQHMGI
jgi:hypothetical protein